VRLVLQVEAISGSVRVHGEPHRRSQSGPNLHPAQRPGRRGRAASSRLSLLIRHAMVWPERELASGNGDFGRLATGTQTTKRRTGRGARQRFYADGRPHHGVQRRPRGPSAMCRTWRCGGLAHHETAYSLRLSSPGRQRRFRSGITRSRVVSATL